MSLPAPPACPLQCLGVARFLFRQQQHSVRFTWGHPSLIVNSSFLMKYPLKDGSWRLGWDCWHWFSVCLLSPLHDSNSHPGIITQILSLSVPSGHMEWNKIPGPALLGYNLESTQAPLCCWVLPVPRPALLFWHSKQDSAFFFLWALILPQCCMWDFTGIKKAWMW